MPTTTPQRKDQGFTLIELLVVVIIIGVLAAIAIPVFLNQRQKAADAATQSDLKNAATLMETWFVDNQSYVATNPGDQLNDMQHSTNVSVVVTSATATGYCLDGTNTASDAKFHYDSDAGGLLDGIC
ncbi:prepilin-type N-terminal cleavage/methylation domain-containing protein [Nocardioides sp. GY 10127]|uniref:type IV pilin protein n=1 Tax=Nocardioides sp. GY 10127 TaxID=2569762 RepID=UPI0010A910DB|nr:prepilin-type N-terminal cleavage/methylation domain-containing protein [Nocardioides sp. GY 10127]TIC78907.1 prepilin-type N-terminal cleavage/methylation domain-containing protein [Nocardioides sp. GY 10127]